MVTRNCNSCDRTFEYEPKVSGGGPLRYQWLSDRRASEPNASMVQGRDFLMICQACDDREARRAALQVELEAKVKAGEMTIDELLDRLLEA
jgi:hypothetical protein